MEFKDLKREIEKNISTKPDTWRYGQFVFNYIDEKYGVARCVQFIDDIDCFYDDSYIDPFILRSVEWINKKFNNHIGTHNSATSSKLVWWQRPFSWFINLFCKCQDKSITQQLSDGIKLFNLQVTYYNNEWVISHGLAIYDCKLSDIISEINTYSNDKRTPIYITIGEDNCFFTKKQPHLLLKYVNSLIDDSSQAKILNLSAGDYNMHYYHIPYEIKENYWFRPNEVGLARWIPIPRLWIKKRTPNFNGIEILDFYEKE